MRGQRSNDYGKQPMSTPRPPSLLTHAFCVSGTTAAAKSNQPPLLLSFKRGKYKLNLPLLNGSVVASAERCTAFSFHPSHSLGTVKTSIRVSERHVLEDEEHSRTHRTRMRMRMRMPMRMRMLTVAAAFVGGGFRCNVTPVSGARPSQRAKVCVHVVRGMCCQRSAHSCCWVAQHVAAVVCVCVLHI